MKLYHFAPAHLLDGIKREGLTRGALTIITRDVTYLFTPCQWLTSDGDFSRQSWATMELINYGRTAVRLTVVIPKSARKLLWRAHDYLPYMPEESRRLITDWEGSENWYMFFGKIPPGWIREIVWKDDKKCDKLATTPTQFRDIM